MPSFSRPLHKNVAPWPAAYGPLYVGPTPAFNPPPTPPVQAFSLTPLDSKGRPVKKKK